VCIFVAAQADYIWLWSLSCLVSPIKIAQIRIWMLYLFCFHFCRGEIIKKLCFPNFHYQTKRFKHSQEHTSLVSTCVVNLEWTIKTGLLVFMRNHQASALVKAQNIESNLFSHSHCCLSKTKLFYWYARAIQHSKALTAEWK